MGDRRRYRQRVANELRALWAPPLTRVEDLYVVLTKTGRRREAVNHSRLYRVPDQPALRIGSDHISVEDLWILQHSVDRIDRPTRDSGRPEFPNPVVCRALPETCAQCGDHLIAMSLPRGVVGIAIDD